MKVIKFTGALFEPTCNFIHTVKKIFAYYSINQFIIKVDDWEFNEWESFDKYLDSGINYLSFFEIYGQNDSQSLKLNISWGENIFLITVESSNSQDCFCTKKIFTHVKKCFSVYPKFVIDLIIYLFAFFIFIALIIIRKNLYFLSFPIFPSLFSEVLWLAFGYFIPGFMCRKIIVKYLKSRKLYLQNSTEMFWNDIIKKIVITISTTSIMGFYSWIWLYLASLFFSQ